MPGSVHIVLVAALLVSLTLGSVHTLDDSFRPAPPSDGGSIRLQMVKGVDTRGAGVGGRDDNSVETVDSDMHGKLASSKAGAKLWDKYKPELTRLEQLRHHAVKEADESSGTPILKLTQVDRNPDAELLPSSIISAGALHPKLVVTDLMIPRPVKSATVLDPAVSMGDSARGPNAAKPVNVIESGEPVITSVNELSSSDHSVSPSKDAVSPSKDAVSPSKDAVSPSKDAVSPSKDAVSPSKDAVSPSKDAVSSSKDVVSSTKDAVDPCLVCDCKGSTSLLSCNRKALNNNYTSLLSSRLLSYKYTTVCLSNNNIEKVTPFPKLEQITRLCLSNNPIKEMKDAVFKGLTNLVALDLSYTKLNNFVLTPNVFQGRYAPDSYEPLKNLKILNLSHNDFHSLNADLFEHLPGLEELHLSHNPLGVIDITTSIALSSIPYLKILDLTSTALSSLPNHLLHTPRYLHTLNLSFNLFHSVPEQLGQSHDLQVLSLNGNPIPVIKSFPALPKLHTLSISFMPELVSLQAGSLSNLAALQSFSAANNSKLTFIHSATFSRTQVSDDGQTRTTVWPPLEKLVLSNNALQRLDGTLVARWDKLKVLDIRFNPWMCDCDNQWLVSSLLPLLEANHPQYINNLKCREPVEMANLNLLDLDHKGYRLRCLDLYNHRPEADSLLLIISLLFALLALPLLINLVLCARRRASAPPLCPNVHYSRAFYKSGVRTDSADVISTHYIL